MSRHTQVTVRPIVADDLVEDPLASWRAVVTNDRFVNRVAVVEQEIVAIGVIDPNGRATLPDDPALELKLLRTAGEIAEAVDALLRELIDEARALEARRLSVGCDPMNVSMLKLLEKIGFKPVGAMPYFDLGGGHVQYVTGYQDATGSTMDLVIDLAS